MANDKKELFGNFAGLAITTGLALVTQGSSHLALAVMGGIAGNLASSYIEKTDYKSIKQLLQETEPSKLNHDLQKLIIRSVKWSIKNIQILYAKNLKDPQEIKQLKTFSKELIDEVEILEKTINSKSESLYKSIENPKDSNELLKLFELKVGDFPKINSNIYYNDFFKKEFTPNLQLCFGELLKKEKNRPAYIAYQREVYQNLDNGIDKIIKQNESIINRLDHAEDYVHQNETLRKVQRAARSTSQDNISPEFETSFNKQLIDLSRKSDILLLKSEEISAELLKVKSLTKNINKEIKLHWVEKNKVRIIGLGLAMCIALFSLYYSLKTQPFDMKISTRIDPSVEIHLEYPKVSKEARIQFHLPNNTIEKELTFLNEIVLTQLPYSIKGKTIRIQLLDKYWQLKSDSLKLQKGQTTLQLRPNQSLGKIVGRVFLLENSAQRPIANANISTIDGLHATTDSMGSFIMNVPVNLQRIKHSLQIEKEGYHTKREDYTTGNLISVQLFHKND